MIRSLERIKALLWEKWDPIGGRGMGGPSDEYDCYAFRVFSLLKSGASEAEVTAYLEAIASEHIGFEPTGRESDIAAQATAFTSVPDA